MSNTTHAQRYCLILLTAMNSVASKTFFSPVILYARDLWLCGEQA